VAGSGLRLSVAPEDMRGLIYAINQMDKEASGKLRNEVSSISKWSAQGIIAASYDTPYPKQTAKVAATVRANRDRIPNVTIGGTRQKFSGGAVAGQVLFGSEFGANPTSVNGRFPKGGRRFPYPSKGYAIFRVLKDSQATITMRWKAAVDDVLNNWSKG